MKRWLLIAGKILIAAVAMYFALRNIDFTDLQQLALRENLLWLIPALILYNLSQFVSAWRLLQLYRLLQPDISYRFNLLLYYRGMFYNLFLPGGIGGDVYKVAVLKNDKANYRQLAIATLLDRLNGLLVLSGLILLLALFIPVPKDFETFRLLFPIAFILCVPGYWFVLNRFFKPYHKAIPLAALASLFVQALQVGSFFCILLFLGVDSGPFVLYAFPFLISSVITALPFSFGGLGTRELVLAAGAAYFNLSATHLVSASLIFFLITVISSVAGWVMNVRNVGNVRNVRNVEM